MDDFSLLNLVLNSRRSLALEFFNTESRLENFKSIFMPSIDTLNGSREQVQNKINVRITEENIYCLFFTIFCNFVQI